MFNRTQRRKLPPAKEAAYIAVTCALLTGGQFVFSFVVGVEIVTLILACFSYVFGARRGAVCAVAFSLLRCIIYPFSPTALILYLTYYPAFSAVFGALGHIKEKTFVNYPVYFAVIINAVLICICATCATAYALDLIKTSRLYKVTVYAMLWVIFALCAALTLAFNALFILRRRKNTGGALKLITLTCAAAVCTICFTLLDDIITPPFYGFSRLTALTYFYGSFLAMLPQTVCTIVSVGTLFTPLTAVLQRVNK